VHGSFRYRVSWKPPVTIRSIILLAAKVKANFYSYQRGIQYTVVINTQDRAIDIERQRSNTRYTTMNLDELRSPYGKESTINPR
jgi:hypothetical protein